MDWRDHLSFASIGWASEWFGYVSMFSGLVSRSWHMLATDEKTVQEPPKATASNVPMHSQHTLRQHLCLKLSLCPPPDLLDHGTEICGTLVNLCNLCSYSFDCSSDLEATLQTYQRVASRNMSELEVKTIIIGAVPDRGGVPEGWVLWKSKTTQIDQSIKDIFVYLNNISFQNFSLPHQQVFNPGW